MPQQRPTLFLHSLQVVILLCLLQMIGAAVIHDRLLGGIGDLEDVGDFDEGLARRSRELSMVPMFLEVWKRSPEATDRERFLAALNTYYMIFGRPRFG